MGGVVSRRIARLHDWLSPEEWTALALTLGVAARACAMALPASFALTLVLGRRFFGRGALDLLVHLPLAVPPVVTGWLLLLVFGVRGPVGAALYAATGWRLPFTTAGAALACAVMILPITLRGVRQSFQAVDPKLLAAARTLGSPFWDRMANVVLPVALPGIVGAAIAGFVTALGEFGAVITFAANIPGQTQTLPLAIYSALQLPGGETAAARLSLVSLALAFGGLWLAERVQRTLGTRLGQ